MDQFRYIPSQVAAITRSRLESASPDRHSLILQQALAVAHQAGVRHAESLLPRRVLQTNIGPETGNCWAACIASLLRLPIESVPNFCGDPPRSRYWLKATNDWLAERHLGAVLLPADPQGAFTPLPAAECIITGKSPRGTHLHAIVGRCSCPDGFNNEIEYLHDPFPGGGWIDGPPREIAFLVPIVPTNRRAAAEETQDGKVPH